MEGDQKVHRQPISSTWRCIRTCSFLCRVVQENTLQCKRTHSRKALKQVVNPVVPTYLSSKNSDEILKPEQSIVAEILTNSTATESDGVLSSQKLRLRVLQQFAADSTIHGIKHIVRAPQLVGRLVWMIAVVVCVASCLALVVKGVIRYYDYGVKTSTSVEYAREVTFPAITICNENLVRKSVISRDKAMIAAAVMLIVHDNQSYEEMFEQSLSSCFIETSVAANETPRIDMATYEFWNRTGVTRAMRLMAPDSYYSLKRCWWRQQEVDCNNYFLNHFTDYGWCFTFNPASPVVRSYNLGYSWTDTAYGIKDTYQELHLTSTGPNNGVRLLLHVNQDDYCITRHGTSGFRVLVHDPNVQPLFFIGETHTLAPGFETSVSVRYQRLSKYTKELDRCTDHVLLDYYPNLTVYFREACYLECFTKYVYKHCDCITPYGPPNANKIMAQQLNVNYVVVCLGPNLLCMKHCEREFLNEGLDKRCTTCKEPCHELRSLVSLSTALFPAKQLVNYYVKKLNVVRSEYSRPHETDEKLLRDNYVMAHVYVETKLIDVIVEDRDFGLEDLVSYLGGTIGFLLGMSTLSLLEIIQAAIHLIFPHA